MIFIDTGGFIARYIKKDQHHKQASLFWEKIAKKKERIYTSTFVLNETFTLLSRWAGTEFSINTAYTLYASDTLRIIRPEQDDEIKALHYMKRLGKSNISFTDCVSFTLMQKYSIENVFTFDNDFTFAGFTVVH